MRKATLWPTRARVGRGPHGVGDPAHARKHLAREPGEPRTSPSVKQAGRWSAAGSRETHAADAQAWEVRQLRSTEEGPEQRPEAGSGGTGGKAAGQAKLATGHHAPDAGPSARARGTGAGTASNCTEERSAIHRAAAPHLRHRHAQG